jgi:hypothetical protein
MDKQTRARACWEKLPDGRGWVVEHDGMLRTGPFADWERAREWFREELDRELPEEPDELSGV